MHCILHDGQSRNPLESTPETRARLYLNKRRQQKSKQYMMMVDMSKLERCHEKFRGREGRKKGKGEEEGRGLR